MNKEPSKQLPFEFYHRPCLGRDDFMTAECNFEAFRLIDSWPIWTYFAACIYGPEGCGKSHLANIFSDKISVQEHYPYKIPQIQASDLTLDMPRRLLNTMFNLYNMYRDEGGFILFTSTEAPARINFSLPDLRSRMNIIPSVEIKEPDDGLLSALLVKLSMDRQLSISPEQINFILNNMQRSFNYARKLVAEIDNISLAQKKAVSIPLIKEAMTALATDNQGDLFA